MKIGVIIQARLGSTRLPGKVLKKFNGEESILDIIYGKIKTGLKDLPAFLATSNDHSNDLLEEWSNNKEITLYRGEENDVLSRFVDVCERNGLTHCIRICADNPFIDIDLVGEVVKSINQYPSFDYFAHNVKGTPSILTHLGIWAEGVSYNALKETMESTNDPFYREHVTNYIYNSTEFKLKWLKAEQWLENSECRLTVDSIDDFKLAQSLYKKNWNTKELFSYLEEDLDVLKLMESNITLNSK